MPNLSSRAAAFDRSPVAALVYAPDGHPRDANRAYRELVGLDPDDDLGLGVWDRVHVDDRRIVLDGWVRYQAGEDLREPPEVRIHSADGSIRWVLISATNLPGHDDIILTLLDVTARKEAEAQRDERARYVQTLLDESADIITVLDPDGTWRSSSPQGTRILGFPRGYDPPGGIFSLVHPDDRAAAASALASVVDGTNDRTVPVEIRLATADGAYRRFDVVAVNLIDDPLVHGIVISARNVTERHLAQTALAASEARYADLVTQMREGLWCLDEAGTTTYVNPRMAEMLGTTPEAMSGRSLFEWIPVETRSQAARNLAARRSGEPDVHEFTFRRSDGTLLPALVSAAPRMVDGRLVEIIGVITDVSALKAVEDRLDAALGAALAANQAKTAFMSQVGHELRTPLHGIVGYASLLGESPDETIARYAQHIERSAHHLERLIEDLADVGRLEQGHLELHLADVGLAELVGTAVALAGIPDDLLVRTVADDLAVVADPVRLTQIVVNLLANAHHHGPADGTITVEAARDGDRVRLRVCDEGPGIALEDARRIFAPFVQLPPTRSGAPRGSGLGLAISRGLAEAMGGSLVLGPDGPTCFELSLPAATDAPPQAKGADRGGVVVVAIADDPACRQLLCDIFATVPSVELVTATRLEDGLHLIEMRHPALAVIDLNLPDGSALDGLAAVRRAPTSKALPVVVVTADTTPAVRTAALAAGADAYLTKPFQVSEMLETVDRLIHVSA